MDILARGSSELKFTSEAEIMEVADETLGGRRAVKRDGWPMMDTYIFLEFQTKLYILRKEHPLIK